MRLRLTPLAEADLGDIASDLTLRDPQAAQRVEAAVREAFAILGAYPEVGHTMRGDVRRYVIPRCPDVISWRAAVVDDALDVLTIRHTVRRPIVEGVSFVTRETAQKAYGPREK